MYSIQRADGAETLPHGRSFRDGSGVLHPWSIVTVWSEQDLAAIGVTRAAPPAPPVVEPVPVDLPGLKATLKAEIDAAAEVERNRYITPGSGQAMTYQAKADEARRYLATAGAGDYPLLNAEVGVTGETLHQVAQIVANLHGQWQIVGGLIERARLSAKASIDAAPDEMAARSVTPEWPAF